MARSRNQNFYVDALAGYAYSNNQLQRQILIPGCSRDRHGQHRRQTSSSARSRAATSSASKPRGCDYHAVRPLPDLQRGPRTRSVKVRAVAQPQRGASRPPTRSARRSAPISAARSASATNASSTSRSALGWLHEFADVARPITAASPARPAILHPCRARLCATPAVVGLQAPPPSPRRRDLPALDARSPPAPTTMR